MNYRSERFGDFFFFFKIQFWVPPCGKRTLNAKRVNISRTLLFLTSAAWLSGFVARWRLRAKAIVKSYTSNSTLSRTHEYLYAD